MDDYKVDLEIFRGPLDLLLHLVKKSEVDICDIPIATITDQYLAYIDLLRMINIDVAAEFLVTASTLMEIKSRMLLPRPVLESDEEDEEDPRLELVRQLMEYKRFKDAAGLLGDRARAEADHFPRYSDDRPSTSESAEDLPIGDVELWDLLEAFGRLMRATSGRAPQNIVYDDTPIVVHMEQLIARLEAEGRIAFSALFDNPDDRGAVIGTFLALLELMKDRKILAEQPETHGDIYLELAPEEPEEPEAPEQLDIAEPSEPVVVSPAALPEPAPLPEPIPEPAPLPESVPEPYPDDPDTEPSPTVRFPSPPQGD